MKNKEIVKQLDKIAGNLDGIALDIEQVKNTRTDNQFQAKQVRDQVKKINSLSANIQGSGTGSGGG